MRLVDVGRVTQHRKAHSESGERQRENAFDGRGIDGDAGGAEAAVEQDLHDQPAERVAHQDGWAIELADDAIEVIDDLRDAEIG